MRRRTMTMTMFAVSVAVVLLGIPLGGAWIALAFRTTPNANDRARVVITVALTIPTMIAGLYGMNVPVPGADDPTMFWKITTVSVIAAMATGYYFLRRR